MVINQKTPKEMKRIVNIILLVLAVGALNSCRNELIMFDESKYFVAFTGDSKIPENGGPIGIPVMVAAEVGSPAVKVTFKLNDGVAVEGKDYTLLNESNELSFTNGWGYETIWIQPVDNSDFTGNKTFTISLESNSLNYAFGSFEVSNVTIIDDEHPLRNWIGTYSVSALSYGNPGNWDETWTVVSTPNPDDPNTLFFTNFGTSGSDNAISVLATFDLNAMTVSIAAGSSIGDAYGYGDMLIYLGAGYPNLDKTSIITGTIDNDGSMHIDNFGLQMTGDYAGETWDVFDTYWTLYKSAHIQKSATLVNSKTDRFKK